MVLLEKLGGGVWPISQNPYPTYDLTKTLIPHLGPLWQAFVVGLNDNDEKVDSSTKNQDCRDQFKTITNSQIQEVLGCFPFYQKFQKFWEGERMEQTFSGISF